MPGSITLHAACGHKFDPTGLYYCPECGVQCKPTPQERALAVELEDAVIRFVMEEKGCACRGMMMAVAPEIKALVAKTLDAKVHGGTLRKDTP